MADFVHLHVHSHFSLLDSTVKVGGLLARCEALEMDAVAITDHANLFGAIEFQNSAKYAGGAVRPIFGAALHVVADRAAKGKQRPCQLVVLCETLDGYRNLVRLVSHSYLNAAAGALPVVDYADLEAYHEGLIALSGDVGGEVAQALLRGDRDAAVAAAERYRNIFGARHFYLELQRVPGLPEFEDACSMLVDLGEQLEIPIVATNNVHYLEAGDHKAHAVLMCIGLDKRVSTDIIDKIPVESLYLASKEEMAERFADLPEAIENTRRIAERCQVTIPTGTNYLPAFDVPEGFDEVSYLRHVAAEGLEARFADFEKIGKEVDRDAYRQRLEVELEIIIQMEFPGYFLIVWDFIRWTREQDIPVGPGRGSGAGSLVAYALLITDIDPIPYGLLFERFLNPERVSMPDFDIDFCQNRRMEVIEYVTRKYGKDNVAMIVTYGQLKAKAAIRDVARVLNLPFAEADRLAKLIPDELGIKLADAYDREPRLREVIQDSETNTFLYETALALEGNHRNTGMHAAGVVISGDPLWEYVPIFTGTNGEYVSQYAKNEVEEAGLVKFDFLGLKTLTVIDDALRLVNRQRADGDALDFATISLDTPEVYELIKTGDTTGIFQMESDGFRKLMRKLKPDCFEDIVAAVALYRPGPLGSGMVEQFIDVKHGRRQADYPHPWLEDVLRETYGVMVYQEQVMKTAQILAGYTLGGADLLRRAMGKKKKKEMDRQRAIFIEGAGKKDIGEAKANEVFDLMAHFAGYGFNKSHSAAYAALTFQTAYLKRFHAAEFYASLMTNDATSTDKVVKYIMDARARGIQVLPPDVRSSEQSFTVDEGRIRFGLGAVKGLGSGPIDAIVAARADGEFASIYDFCERVDGKRCGKRVLEALVRCGALDASHPDARGVEGAPSLRDVGQWRAQFMAVLDAAVERGNKSQRDKESGQSNLFNMFAEAMPAAAPAETYPEVKRWNEKQVLQFEKDTLGFFVSGHPLDRYRDEIASYTDCTSQSLAKQEPRAEVRMAGVITSLRERPVKSGEGRMAFFQLEDHFGETEVICWSKTYPELAEVLTSDDPILISGTVKVDGDGEDKMWKLVANSAQPLWEARTAHVREMHVSVESDQLTDALLDELVAAFEQHPGRCAPILHINFGTAEAQVRLPQLVTPADELMNTLVDLLGDQRVRFR